MTSFAGVKAASDLPTSEPVARGQKSRVCGSVNAVAAVPPLKNWD